MDNDMDDDLDDLFGEAAPLPLPLPLSPSLVSSLNERAQVGCCQRVTWAKSGVIAYCTHDARDVVLQHLLCDPNDGQWRLSKQHNVEGLAAAHGAAKLVHLSWDPSGNYLALCDSSGRVSVCMVAIVMNRITVSRRYAVDHEDDLSGIVGFVWLHGDRSPSYYYKPALLKDGQWNFTMTQQNAYGPRPPASKPSLIAMTRAGTIKVIYQDKENRWHQIRSEQERPISNTGIFSHAAFCVDKGNGSDGMLLATFDADSQLRVFRLHIDFERSIVNLKHICLLSCALPDTNMIGGMPVSMAAFNSQYRLAHLDIIPAGPESKSRGRTPVSVLAAFSSVTRNLQGADAVSTVVSTWSLLPSETSLHPSLSSLAPTKVNERNKAPNATEYHLKSSSSFSTDKVLLSIQQVNTSTVLFFAWNDGVIESRDSQSLESLPLDGNGQISGLGQIGFAFPSDRSCTQTALSPNSCAAFSFDESSYPNIVYLQYLDSRAAGGPLNAAILSTINEALGVQLSIAARGSNADDLLATIQLFSSQFLVPQMPLDFMPLLTNTFNFNRTLVGSVYRNLGMKLESSMEEQPDHLIRNPVFQRCLGYQAAIGFQGRLNARPIEGTVGLMLLQLRYVIFMWNFAASAKSKNGADTELKKPETMTLLLPTISWLLTFFSFIVDEAFSMQRFFEEYGVSQHEINIDHMNAQIHQAQSPALLMLYSSSCRTLLKYSLRFLKGFAAEGEKYHDSSALGRVFREFDMTMQNTPIKVSQFDKLLNQIDNSVKIAYQEGNLSESDRRSAEEQMLVRAELPQILVGSVVKLLFELLPSLQEEVNETELYFQDVSRLGLTYDDYTRTQNQLKPVDAMTKSPLRRNGKVRRCTRCCSLMDEIWPQKNANFVSGLFARTCFCGSLWMVLDGEDLAQT